MVFAFDPAYVIRQEADGTFSIVDSKTGRIADSGGCVLGRLDATMASGLIDDLNRPEGKRRDTQPSRLS